MALTNHTSEKNVAHLFNQIAPQYDQMNSVISLGTHRLWRRRVMGAMRVAPGNFALDLCCGTGDWTLALAQAVGPRGQVVGLDLSSEMLAVARQKVTAAHLQSQITLKAGDAMHLPYPDNHFDVVTIGFGLRNVPDAQQVLNEMTRVVKPGGQVVCLETSQPTNPLVHAGWQVYFGHLVPLMGRVVAHHYQAYNYLQRTTHEFVSAETLAQMFTQAGLQQVHFARFNLGAAAVHFGLKPRSK
ncbi:demethylmenaquinone methyltransferase [Levilactobacillus acidifarinae]|uniref:Demethylmenaquinone methyltransferase n=1 Tax=Levilactobacillus acidifarinae DSM 19394 = JCM 15949 TaxID=1423715 RepID=A0A0R1LLY3_9LACO|nr:demethylmenaquinone methyltransferase [Levilactobacillus acidifarinae]KRK94052.1 SAM-dependent methyltransferase [Levilactobacillus acidifarinae DSM 19394]GEO69783.1 demethylmenaquinone methyltransferase [Levilactobacillus acidifarinae]